LQESSDLPVALLLAQHKDRSTQLEMQLEKPRSMKPVTFSTGIKMGSLVLIIYLKDSFQDYAFKFCRAFYTKVNDLDI
jgi:CDK-activating kinase assembly factor MAT1